eukprot:scaffold531124_cov59-Attheya_sp.AAC.1
MFAVLALVFQFAQSLQIPNGIATTKTHISGHLVDNKMIRLLFPIESVGHSSPEPNTNTRRAWLASTTATVCGAMGVFAGFGESALAEETATGYDNPNMPAGPEERSGLVILRVAEVANFQEKILRAIVNKDLDAIVSPQQIVFGTQILLRNSNIAGNMKLMIDTEVPRARREEAALKAALTMNTLQRISSLAASIQRPFKSEEMLDIADLYREVRLQLNAMYEYLPPKEKEKYYGYFMAVTQYEKKIAEGVYNPDIDGVLKFDD